MNRIAIVGMACQYPDADSPRALWENAISGRRAFRRLPDVRMNLADYYDPDPSVADRFYARTAAVLEGYEFDRPGHKIAGSTYRSTDLTHWLALETAGRALADAGFADAEGMPREHVGAIIGNTLTGEFTRANLMRLRWPYVRRTVAASLQARGWSDDQLSSFLAELEVTYKQPFPVPDEDTLVGGLSNTIAGRICNYFDFNGGGYTVDGACASSLLSVTTACKALLDHDLDVAVAGGVDLSIDPFEIIGFAKTGALARTQMRLYDRGSNGFWPGEGCGIVVLMREQEAIASRRRIYATIAGFGISSDGKGGITRPEVQGYHLALQRAYQRAGFGIETVALFEGHGTGTEVGDATELRALSSAREQASAGTDQVAIGSIKGMIGHTKAAAGVAGLIKAAMAVHHEVLPPSIGTVDPHPLLTDSGARLRVLRAAESWPVDRPVRAGVTAMGFGGINTHVVLEKSGPAHRRRSLDARTRELASSVQDAELLLIDGDDLADLRTGVQRLLDFVPALAYAEVSDLANTLQRDLGQRRYRAAVVVTSPEDALQRLNWLLRALEAGPATAFSADGRCFLGQARPVPRIGLLFPGQGSGRGLTGGALRRRFPEIEAVYTQFAPPAGGDPVATAVAQPRIVTGSVAGLQALSLLGIDGSVAVGHSLGEISALHWAGAMDERTLLRVAQLRGRTMAEHSASGTMASIGAPAEAVAGLLAEQPVVIAGYNGPTQTVIAGSREAVEVVIRDARLAGFSGTALAVSHAFHSPLVAPAAGVFADLLAQERFTALNRRVISTVAAEPLAADVDIPGLLRRQITEPVRFAAAVAIAAREADLFIEVGPGRVLSTIATTVAEVPAVALDTDDESLASLLGVVGAAYVLGVPDVQSAVFQRRFFRQLELDHTFRFLASPAESAALIEIPDGRSHLGSGASAAPVPDGGEVEPVAQASDPVSPAGEVVALDLLRELTAERAELPLSLVNEGSRLLDDLHLSSITVGQLVNQAAERLGVPATSAPTVYATVTVAELAQALQALADDAPARAAAPVVAGAAAWARPFRIDQVPLPRGPRPAAEEGGTWQLHASPDDPWASKVQQALESAGVGSGVLVCLPQDCSVADLEPVLAAAQAAIARPAGDRFVLLQQPGRGAAGLAKTLRLEAPQLRVTIVQSPLGPEVVPRTVAEVAATTTFAEVHYDEQDRRTVPTLRAMPAHAAPSVHPLTDSDVLLVTGGGKGITAECALAISTDSGAKLAVLGRSAPEEDQELAGNLARMSAAGVQVHYARADITDAEQVSAAIAELTAAVGPVTALLHGAGRNEPMALSSLTMAEVESTFAPKVDGLQTVLAAIDPGQLKLFVTFGSIIGRSGLRGEAHYALANEWLADLTTEVADQHPQCRCLCLEWSVWSGVGMGERLSVVETLIRDGVTPVTVDQGVQILRRLVSDPVAPTTVVISGRTEGIDTIRRELPELPLLRFIGNPLVRYHGIEIVTEVELAEGTDLYLGDHLLDGNMLLPAVFGMEAMAQVAVATTGASGPLVFEDLQFARPILVAPGGSTTIRIAVVATDENTVEATILSSETGFAAEHFRARLRFAPVSLPPGGPDQVADGLPAVPLDPATDLYGGILFQGKRFQRLVRYHRAAARDVDVEVKAQVSGGWFASYLPAQLLLGDPGMRDALMHGTQVCVPNATLLPSGVDRVFPAAPFEDPQLLRYCASERARDGDSYVYDIAVRDGDGQLVERWEGLRLQAVRKDDGRGPFPAVLLGAYLERSVEDLLHRPVAVAIEPDSALGTDNPRESDHRASTALAAGRTLGAPVEVRYRPDGKPTIEAASISAAHGAGLTICVTGEGTLACDIQAVTEQSDRSWSDLLGAHARLAELVAADTGESGQVSATRVWSALECLQKGGQPLSAPLTLVTGGAGPWTLLVSGQLAIATLVTTVRDVRESVVFAILVDGWS